MPILKSLCPGNNNFFSLYIFTFTLVKSWNCFFLRLTFYRIHSKFSAFCSGYCHMLLYIFDKKLIFSIFSDFHFHFIFCFIHLYFPSTYQKGTLSSKKKFLNNGKELAEGAQGLAIKFLYVEGKIIEFESFVLERNCFFALMFSIQK